MGEFDYRVERQRVLLEAEEWAKGISSVQYHGLTSMWYETKESKMYLMPFRDVSSVKKVNKNGILNLSTQKNEIVLGAYQWVNNEFVRIQCETTTWYEDSIVTIVKDQYNRVIHQINKPNVQD